MGFFQSVSGQSDSSETEYYFNDLGKIILKKHTDPAFSDEYFIYNLQGDLIKDSSDTVYLIEFEYSEDTLWLRKSKYKNDREHLVYHVKYEFY